MKVLTMVGALGASVALLTGAAGTQLAQAASPSCAALDDPIYQVVNPKVGSSLLTAWSGEATKAKANGFTENLGEVFRGSTVPATGLVGMHRLYNTKTGDFLYTVSSKEVGNAVATGGYTDQGVSFYVAAAAGKDGCSVAVPRLVKGTNHRVAATPAAQAALTASGWRVEGAKFFVGPRTGPATNPPPVTPEPSKPTPVTPDPVTPPKPTAPSATGPFTFAVIPDTQNEVLKAGDNRLQNRNAWLVQQKVSFALHTGDLVNWDTDQHEQYSRAGDAMRVLTENHIPFTLGIGNHDTMATGVGGSARPGKTWELIRDTRTMNANLSTADLGEVDGAFEPGKIDNVYATYQAGGKKFLVLALEFCPRKAAVEWARGVVASHPDHNVIINTHSYLTSSGAINGRADGYGDASPQYLFDKLVSQYPNVKMVFSGHVGVATKARVDKGAQGNKVYSFLTTFHEAKTNPVRMLTVDTKKGTITTKISAPLDGKRWTTYDQTISGVDFV